MQAGRQAYTPTSMEDWTRSEAYHNAHLIKPNPALTAAIQASVAAGLPDIAVSAAQGKLLNLLIRTLKCTRVLEVGTLGGYSAIWMASALPEGGELVTLEIDPKHAEIAQANITNAGLSDKVKIMVGPALDVLPTLQPSAPFDLAFIDADKESNSEYFQHAERLVRSGGVIVVDNVVRYGRVADPAVKDSRVEGVRRLLKYLETDDGVECTTISTVGEKGHDGFIYALRL